MNIFVKILKMSLKKPNDAFLDYLCQFIDKNDILMQELITKARDSFRVLYLKKNELFVKESLMEYSLAIMDASSDVRIETTLEKIYNKLENINLNLLKNDIGIGDNNSKDTGLRDAFIKLNVKTITLLKNKSLKLKTIILTPERMSVSEISLEF